MQPFSVVPLAIAAAIAFPEVTSACNPAEIAPYDAYDSRVFNWQYYLNQNPDLIPAGLYTEAQAKQHWYANGICEGRSAHPNFHSKQYLAGYSDVNTHFGGRRSGAIRHYLQSGISEGRYGYNPYEVNGQWGKWVARNTPFSPHSADLLTVSGSTRTAGTIDSVFWKGKEYINSWDHGRQLQPAVFVNGDGICNNPTMAGGDYDGVQPTTHSTRTYTNSSGSTVVSKVLAAYWTAPGQIVPKFYCPLRPETYPGSGQVKAVNTKHTSDYKIETTVTAGYKYPNVIKYYTYIVIPEYVTGLMTEAVTGYLPGDMSYFYAYDLAGQKTLTALSIDAEQNKPLVVSNAGGDKAMGIWSPGLPQPGLPTELLKYGYGIGHHPSSNPIESTMKWNVVYRHGAANAGAVYGYTTYIVLGSKTEVTGRMDQIYTDWKNGRL
ncbi:MAG: hypothetical protein E6Q88_12170 [Lysobacteraceae bacterium]|nr:MAG: hypothetical protein E6Q88_12170 [Xanthomonadaceae bacterium]